MQVCLTAATYMSAAPLGIPIHRHVMVLLCAAPLTCLCARRQKIKEIEDEMARTQKNKATSGHLGMLKVRLCSAALLQHDTHLHELPLHTHSLNIYHKVAAGHYLSTNLPSSHFAAGQAGKAAARAAGAQLRGGRGRGQGRRCCPAISLGHCFSLADVPVPFISLHTRAAPQAASCSGWQAMSKSSTSRPCLASFCSTCSLVARHATCLAAAQASMSTRLGTRAWGL